ncbi:hypothetical protein SEA_ASEGATO_120 [Microbacterium phage ASegato]|nr:hypothetical protein SEA_ASEGATO_6 [Microbacterium phage ASegato]WNO26009.1 hypothetical protein SEA_ASEGATO_120 [Microbacterium phage ASegato]
MAYRKNQTNAQIVPLALKGIEGETTTGNMSTNSYRVGFSRFTPYSGNLPKSWARLLGERFHAGRIAQVIYSYSTPIAWLDADYGWIIPAVTYSATTSIKHQSQLYRLQGRRIEVPWDATAEDMRRVLSGEMFFLRAGKWGTGNWQGTRPGPNYVAGE